MTSDLHSKVWNYFYLIIPYTSIPYCFHLNSELLLWIQILVCFFYRLLFVICDKLWEGKLYNVKARVLHFKPETSQNLELSRNVLTTNIMAHTSYQNLYQYTSTNNTSHYIFITRTSRDILDVACDTSVILLLWCVCTKDITCLRFIVRNVNA